MVRFWRDLHRWASRGLQPTYDKLYDEERLEEEPGLWWRHRQQKSWPAWPRKATVYLFLIDMVIVVLLLQALEPLITLLLRNEELFSPQVTLSSFNVSYVGNEAAQVNHIPQILHQTTATEQIPDRWMHSQHSCKEAYSDFQYKLWTDDSAREFLSNHYSWFVETWDNYAFPIQRADSIRYFVLYHYGGIYLDMDSWCNQTIPIHKLGAGNEADYALFKSTLPTGITNDLLVTSARHPVYAAAIAKLPLFNAITRPWARLQPYCAIMISAGPMFLTMVAKDYLLGQPSLPSKALGVINSSELVPYITDLESSTWHQSDAKVLMWIGRRPWTWFTMGTVGLAAGLYIINHLLIHLCKISFGKVPSDTYSVKLAKEA
ncbi:uncharacterized protein N7458_004372 [Penicillium daleae]|uniref:Mannosyl phosphorylinositol ceramide synthase SUR1 n=1 Tax=Penicillium daleae TaxID=63821 RepID=A0AAD6G2H3_9EURO|nr:uncharacterized protein N7458_004372 [Penicillium daleae]KAJ5453416.1 hypothetical protein N7458_004372 [Penicillium daleae]